MLIARILRNGGRSAKSAWLAALLLIIAVPSSGQSPIPAPPQIGATSYLLVDMNSGKILASRDPGASSEPASITKIMTSYVAFEELKAGTITLDEMVTISEKAWRTEGSRTFVEVGTQVSVETLLKGLIIQSGNDATVALAEHIAGTEEAFAQIMNAYAEQLGMTSSNFVNSTGLPDPSHYTTTQDIAILSRALIRNFPEYYAWYSEKEFTYNGIRQHNRNNLLWRDPSVDGIKTGHTDSAGYCLVSSGKRGDMRLISVVMNSTSEASRASESQALLNYGFRFFETHRLYAANETLSDAKVWKGSVETVAVGLNRDLFVTIPRGRYSQLDASMDVLTAVTAPVDAGADLGAVRVMLGEETVAEAPLVALVAVPEGNLWQRMRDHVRMWFESE